MRDPYEVLGVPRTASAADIKRAFRKLAKQYHPDKHPGNARMMERFKEISAANELLSDTDKRGQYDRGEIAADGSPRAPQFRRHEYAGTQRPAGGPFGFEAGAGRAGGGMEDILSELFGGFGGARRASSAPKARGADLNHKLTVSFMDAAKGCKERVIVEGGKPLDVTIPAGVRDGSQIRLRGQGGAGQGGGAAGDLLIEISIDPHLLFKSEGADIHLSLPVSLPEAVLGAKIEVPTIDGPVSMNVRKGANSGDKLRLKGRGMVKPGNHGRGDQIVTLQVRLPDIQDEELRKFAEAWGASHAYNPRAGLKTG